MTQTDQKYYFLSWTNVTNDEFEAAESLPAGKRDRQINRLLRAFVRTLPDVTGKALATLRTAGAEPKFVQNPYALGIAFKTADAAVCDEFRNDPHVILLDSSEECYSDPDGFMERLFGARAKTGQIVVGRVNIGTITPKLDPVSS